MWVRVGWATHGEGDQMGRRRSQGAFAVLRLPLGSKPYHSSLEFLNHRIFVTAYLPRGRGQACRDERRRDKRADPPAVRKDGF